MLKNKWSCTKLIGGRGLGGFQNSYNRTDPNWCAHMTNFIRVFQMRSMYKIDRRRDGGGYKNCSLTKFWFENVSTNLRKKQKQKHFNGILIAMKGRSFQIFQLNTEKVYTYTQIIVILCIKTLLKTMGVLPINLFYQ